MKRNTFCLLWSSLCAMLLCSCLSGSDKPSDAQANKQPPAQAMDTAALKKQLVQMELDSWAAWQKRDGAFYSHFLSEDHVELGAGGPSSKKEVVDFVGSPVCVVQNYSADQFQMTQLDDHVAVLTYHAAQQTSCNGKAVPSPAWVSSVYVLRNGKWLNAVYQQTPAHK